jgi:hypothetical protein
MSKYGRNLGRCGLCCKCCQTAARGDHDRHPSLDQFGGERRKQVIMIFRPAKFDCQIAPSTKPDSLKPWRNRRRTAHDARDGLLSRDSADYSRSAMNIRVFPALPQGSREVRTATGALGSPSGLIWHFRWHLGALLPSMACERMTIERLTWRLWCLRP